MIDMHEEMIFGEIRALVREMRHLNSQMADFVRLASSPMYYFRPTEGMSMQYAIPPWGTQVGLGTPPDVTPSQAVPSETVTGWDSNANS